MEKQKEIWKQVKGFNLYYVSNLGNVKSFNCTSKNGRLLVPALNNRGYYGIGLRNNSKTYHLLISRLIALTFIKNPQNLKTVNHKNGIKTDNRVENLEWCSYSQNHIHAYAELNKIATLEKRPVKQYTLDNEFINVFDSISNAARYTKVPTYSISQNCRGESKTAYGFVWKYKNQL